MIYPSGTRVRQSHDARGRLDGVQKVSSSGTVLTNYLNGLTYNPASQPRELNLGNGVVEKYFYSAERLQLTGQTATKSGLGVVVMDLTYNYQAGIGDSGFNTSAGNSGQLMSITGVIGGVARGQTFKYDNVARLKKATGWNTWNRRYEYDRWNNRIDIWEDDIPLAGGGTGPCLKNRVNVLKDINGAPVSNRASEVSKVIGCDAVLFYKPVFDNAGNMVNDELNTYTYDAENRQVSASGSAIVSDVYDTSNRRVRKTAGGVTTNYIWEGSQVIAEYNASTATLLREYIYAGGRMIAREQGGTIRYFHQDKLSTRAITDGNGDVVGIMDNYPFGEEVSSGGETEKHRFTSYERDSELYTDYAINRQYQPETGRFMQTDPIAGSKENPQTLNRYGYTGNDPINFTDPLGLKSKGFCFGYWVTYVTRINGKIVSVVRGGFIPVICVGQDILGKLDIELKFNINKDQKSKQGELRECGKFKVIITISKVPKDQLDKVNVHSVEASAYPGSIRQVGESTTTREGSRITFTATYQAGNILGRGATTSLGLKYTVVAGTTQGDTIVLATGEGYKRDYQGSYIPLRDTMEGGSKDPFKDCPKDDKENPPKK